MQNKNALQVSDFNTELKLKGFNVFQIESDGELPLCTAERISIKFVDYGEE